MTDPGSGSGWSRPREVNGVLILLILQGFAALAGFLLHIAGARSLSVESYGVFGFGWTLAGVLTLVAALGYPNLVLRVSAQYEHAGDLSVVKGLVFDAVRHISVASGLCVTALLLGAALAYAVEPRLIGGLLVAASIVPFVALGLVRARLSRGLGGIACSIVPEEVLRPVVVAGALMAIGAFISPDADPWWIAFGSGIACGLSLLVGVVCVGRQLPLHWRETSINRRADAWWPVRRPMLAASVLQEATSRVDVLLLGLISGFAAVAQLSVCTRLALLNVFVLHVVDSYYSPRMAAAHASGSASSLQRTLRRASTMSTVGALPVAGIMLVWPTELLSLFGGEYSGGAFVLRALALGQLVNAATGPVGYGLLMTGQESAFAWITAGTLVLAIVAHSVVIPLFGVDGAAAVTATVVAAQNLLMRTVLQVRVRSYG